VQCRDWLGLITTLYHLIPDAAMDAGGLRYRNIILLLLLVRIIRFLAIKTVNGTETSANPTIVVRGRQAQGGRWCFPRKVGPGNGGEEVATGTGGATGTAIMRQGRRGMAAAAATPMAIAMHFYTLVSDCLMSIPSLD
jgi:hypothetical protein